MDYRAFQEKYGNKINKALTDSAFINWLISVLKLEGFGAAKQVTILDGFKTKAVKISEDDSNIFYKVDNISVNAPTVSAIIDQGSTYEWGFPIAIADLTVDITVTRKTYALDSLAFTGVDQVDFDRTAIDAAGVNDNLTFDYPWTFSNIENTGQLNNGDTLVGTVVATDDAGQITTGNISLIRQDRWTWGLTNSTMSSPDIAIAIGTKSGNIVPADADEDFYELTTGTGTFPPELLVDTYGTGRTLFIASIPTLEFYLESTLPFQIPSSIESIDINGISGGNANVTRSYNVQTIDLNTLVTLIKK